MAKVIIVGGGAAGMLAAAIAAKNGHRVSIFERNEKLGKKLFITGKGRCNLTNDCDVEDLLAHVVSNPKFLYSAFYGFDSRQMMSYMEGLGLKLKTERGGRVFPASDKSSSVIQTFERELARLGVDIRYHTRVVELVAEEGIIKGVRYKKTGPGENISLEKYYQENHNQKNSQDIRQEDADMVLLATGGKSYASTGSSGDGYFLAEKLGHTIRKPEPSLVPFETKEDWPQKLQGLSLKNVRLTMKDGKRTLYEEQGEMLFTHFGISGPLVLSASTQYGKAKEKPVRIHLDCKPALTWEQLDERVLRDFAKYRNSFFKNALGDLLPSKMIPVVINLSGIPDNKRVNEITQDERKRLVSLLKNMTMTVEGPRGFSEAIITRGGISVKEIDPSSMESKLVKGLFFAGEVMDLDAYTGGYNLQIAWSTAYAAVSTSFGK